MSRLSRAFSDALGGSYSRRGSISDDGGRYISRETRRYDVPRGRSGYPEYAYTPPPDDYYPPDRESPRSTRDRSSGYYNYSPEALPRRRQRSTISPGPGSSRTLEASDSSRNSRRYKSHIIEDSRPPVTTRGIPTTVYHQPIDPQYAPPSPRREPSSSSRRSRSKTSPEREGRLSRLLRRSSSRNESREKLSRPEPRSKSERPRGLAACVICMDDVSLSKGADLKCGHRMCHSCLRRIFRMSVTDPQHMPPRCCGVEDIPLKYVDRLFDTSFKKNWNAKYEEYTSRNRLYCPARKCGEWIRPDSIRRDGNRKYGKCSRCKTKVCAKCGEKMHTSSKCPKDESTKQLLSQAKEEGWKRCYQCKAMVERKEGCNHMTCRCGAEFCIVCGVKWKGCDCPWFNNQAANADRLEHMNIPGREYVTGPGHYPTHAQTYGDEMRLRRLQEIRDSVVARDLQRATLGSSPPYEMMGAVGGVTGVGNAARHFMNESYRPPAAYPVPAYRERATRHPPTPPDAAPISRGVSDPYGRRRRPESPPAAPLRDRNMFPFVRDEPRYAPRGMKPMPPDPGLMRSRSERVLPVRGPRSYEEEANIYAPRHRRHVSASPAKSSAMAGLNGRERGEGRVAEWATFVEPGVPEGESVVGHV